MRELFENTQPIVLFPLLWYVVPLLALGEGLRRKFTGKGDYTLLLYTCLAGIELWAFILADTIPGKAVSIVGAVLALLCMGLDKHGRQTAGVLFGFGLLLVVRSFTLVDFDFASLALLGYTILVAMWVLWRVGASMRDRSAIPAKESIALAALLGIVPMMLGSTGVASVVGFTVGALAVLVAGVAFLWAGSDRNARRVAAVVFLSAILILLALTNPHS